MTAIPAQRVDGDHSRRLVELAQKGDRAALGELWRLYQPQVRRLIYGRTSRLSLTDDLSSEVWLRVMKALPAYEWQGRDFGAFLTTITRNLVADHYKRAWTRYEVGVDDILDVDRADDGRHAQPETAALDAITHARLHELLAKLTPDQRAVITFRYLHDLSPEETGEVMGRHYSAVNTLLYRAMARLEQAMGRGIDERGAPPRTRALAKVRVPS